MHCYIKMKDEKDAMRVSSVAAKSDLDLEVTSTGSVRLDPRSFLALFTLIGKRVALTAPDNTDPAYFAKLVKKMGVLI